MFNKDFFIKNKTRILLVSLIMGVILLALFSFDESTNLSRFPTKEEKSHFIQINRVPSQLISVIETKFPPTRCVNVKLYLVTNGEYEKYAEWKSYNYFRNHSILYDRIRGVKTSKISIMLIKHDAVNNTGQKIQTATIKVRGTHQGGGNERLLEMDFEVTENQTFTGQLNLNEDYIIYVEGKKKFITRPQMGIEEFAKLNDGKFLVIKAKLESR